MLDAQDDMPLRLRSRRRDSTGNEKVSALASKLENDADERVRHRSVIENRWIEDLQQFHGQYSDVISNKLKSSTQNRSTININITRIKTNAQSARLIDLLFPTDDKNWSIGPTPVPEMDDAEGDIQGRMDVAVKSKVEADEEFDKVGKSADLEAEASPELLEAGQAQDAADAEVDVLQDALDQLAEIRTKAKKSSDLMESEIDDQLKACRYQAQCRDVIDDACRIGTGVMKGPIVGEVTHKRWGKDRDEYQLADVNDMRPAFIRVDPWSFFPDPSARNPEESEGFFERHLMNRKQLRRLAKRQDMDQDAIRELVKIEPAEKSPANMTQLFSINGDETHNVKNKYQVWEYTGPIEPGDLALLVDVYDDAETADAMQEFDPLDEINVKVWFCQNEVLSFSLHPLDSGDPIYSVFNIENSETSMFGYGVPRIMRDPVSALNAAWRGMMDNGNLAAGPQIVIAKDRIEPADGSGDYTLRAFKAWTAKAGNKENPPFQMFHIEMNQGFYANIIEMAHQAIDTVTGLPSMAQGEPGTMPQQTATGVSILMNAANVVIRRIVKMWDDDMTIPNLRRIYDFNMQFTEKEEIKGDYEVDARGSSVLLSREIQAPNLIMMADRFGENDRYADWINEGGLVKEVFKASALPVAGLLRSDREREQEVAKRAKAQMPDPMVAIKEDEIAVKREEIESRTAIAEMESAARTRVAELNYKAVMQRLEIDGNLRDDERIDRIEDKEAERGLKSENIAIEVAMQEKTGKSAGGSV